MTTVIKDGMIYFTIDNLLLFGIPICVDFCFFKLFSNYWNIKLIRFVNQIVLMAMMSMFRHAYLTWQRSDFFAFAYKLSLGYSCDSQNPLLLDVLSCSENNKESTLTKG